MDNYENPKIKYCISFQKSGKSYYETPQQLENPKIKYSGTSKHLSMSFYNSHFQDYRLIHILLYQIIRSHICASRNWLLYPIYNDNDAKHNSLCDF